MAEVLNLGMAAAANSVMDRGTAMRVRHRIEAVTQFACRVWTMHHHSGKRLGSRIIWATQLPTLCGCVLGSRKTEKPYRCMLQRN